MLELFSLQAKAVDMCVDLQQTYVGVQSLVCNNFRRAPFEGVNDWRNLASALKDNSVKSRNIVKEIFIFVFKILHK